MRLTCLRGAAAIALNNGISAVVEEPRAFAGQNNGTFAVVEGPRGDQRYYYLSFRPAARLRLDQSIFISHLAQ